MATQESLVAPEWELIDPTPDPIALFMQYNTRFFWGKLDSVVVRWSPQMTSCAGVCCYEGRGGLCSIRLSKPLLTLRPRKDLVETLLHEMIHAYLFVTQNNRDRDGHGPEFQKHMHRINHEAKTKISIYHSFHDEVHHYQTHIWKCDGPCKDRKPYFGFLRRAKNRAPGPNDFWWKEHQSNCGGTYHKISEPEEFTRKQQEKKKREEEKAIKEEKKKKGEITSFFDKNNTSKKATSNTKSGKATTTKPSTSTKPSVSNNIPDKTKQVFTGVNVLGGNSSTTQSNTTSRQANPPVRRIPGYGEIPVRVPAAQPNISDIFSKSTSNSSTATKPEQSNSNDTGYDTSPSSPEDVFAISSQSTDNHESNSRVKVEVFSPGAKSKSVDKNKSNDTASSHSGNRRPGSTSKSTNIKGKNSKPIIPLTNGLSSSILSHTSAYVLCDSDEDMPLVRTPDILRTNNGESSQSGSGKRKRPQPKTKNDAVVVSLSDSDDELDALLAEARRKKSRPVSVVMKPNPTSIDAESLVTDHSPTSRSIPANTQAPQHTQPDIEQSQCPICGLSMPSEVLPYHADECLLAVGGENTQDVIVIDNPALVRSAGLVSCPICCTNLPMDRINQHIDSGCYLR